MDICADIVLISTNIQVDILTDPYYLHIHIQTVYTYRELVMDHFKRAISACGALAKRAIWQRHILFICTHTKGRIRWSLPIPRKFDIFHVFQWNKYNVAGLLASPLVRWFIKTNIVLSRHNISCKAHLTAVQFFAGFENPAFLICQCRPASPSRRGECEITALRQTRERF